MGRKGWGESQGQTEEMNGIAEVKNENSSVEDGTRGDHSLFVPGPHNTEVGDDYDSNGARADEESQISGIRGDLVFSSNPSRSDESNTREDYSTELMAEMLSKVLINYVQKLHPGLLRFYDQPTEQLSVISHHVKRGVPFANTIRKHVGLEGALGLAVLTLYGLVMIIGMNLSVWACTYCLAVL